MCRLPDLPRCPWHIYTYMYTYKRCLTVCTTARAYFGVRTSTTETPRWYGWCRCAATTGLATSVCCSGWGRSSPFSRARHEKRLFQRGGGERAKISTTEIEKRNRTRSVWRETSDGRTGARVSLGVRRRRVTERHGGRVSPRARALWFLVVFRRKNARAITPRRGETVRTTRASAVHRTRPIKIARATEINVSCLLRRGRARKPAGGTTAFRRDGAFFIFFKTVWISLFTPCGGDPREIPPVIVSSQGVRFDWFDYRPSVAHSNSRANIRLTRSQKNPNRS